MEKKLLRRPKSSITGDVEPEEEEDTLCQILLSQVEGDQVAGDIGR
jgi:hypothetical protein